MALACWNRWVLVLLLTAGAALAETPVERDALSNRLLEQVEHWHEQARNGDANAMFNLGQYFRRGIGIKPDLQRASGFYKQAAELGHVGAQLNLGTLYYFAPDKPNLEQVEYWWQKAARQGDASAQYQLAVLYLKLPKPRPLDALAWMTLANENGQPQAEKALQQLKSSMPADIQAGLPQRLVELRSATQVSDPAAVKESIAPSAVQSDVAAVTTAATPEPKAEPSRSEPEARSAIVWAKAVYTVQLASLADETAARAMMQQLMQRYAAVLADHPMRVLNATLQGKDIYRVQAGAFVTRADASLLCNELKISGQGCFLSRLR